MRGIFLRDMPGGVLESSPIRSHFFLFIYI